MTIVIIVIVVWFSNTLQPLMLEVGSEASACRMIGAQDMGVGSKILDIRGYRIYPDISAANTVVVKSEPFMCPSSFNFDTLLDSAEKETLSKMAGKECLTNAEKKDLKEFFKCVSERKP